MQGILGFLENSTGLYLNDTIETLQRIHAEEDYIILKTICSLLKTNRLSTGDFRANVNSQKAILITNFSNSHGSTYEVIWTNHKFIFRTPCYRAGGKPYRIGANDYRQVKRSNFRIKIIIGSRG